MHYILSENEIKYEGYQLSPHWIYKNFKIMGDAIVGFTGECEVKLTEMVDIEDVICNKDLVNSYMNNTLIEKLEKNNKEMSK